MADMERIRIEIAFDGQQVLSVLVPQQTADDLDRSLAEARRRLWEAGFVDALLWVLDGNDRAVRFYEGEGWTADGARREERPYGVVSNVSRFRRPL